MFEILHGVENVDYVNVWQENIALVWRYRAFAERRNFVFLTVMKTCFFLLSEMHRRVYNARHINNDARLIYLDR
jgi:hypothetical protein